MEIGEGIKRFESN